MHSLWYWDSRSDSRDGYWLVGRQCIQYGYARQRDDSCPGQDGAKKHKILSGYSEQLVI